MSILSNFSDSAGKNGNSVWVVSNLNMITHSIKSFTIENGDTPEDTLLN